MHPECYNLVFLFFELYYINAFIYYTLLFGSGFVHQALAHFHRYRVYSLVYHNLLNQSTVDILCIPKVRIMPLHFHKRPMLVPTFTNQKTSEEYFRFYKKKARSENNIQRPFCSEPLEAVCTPSGGTAQLSPLRTVLGMSASHRHSFELHLNLFCAFLLWLCVLF